MPVKRVGACANPARRAAVPTGRAAAFTLVELLVVIGIISVLIAMLLPALNRARAQATQIECLSNLRQLGMATQLYAHDYRGAVPTSRIISNNNATWWWVQLTPYLSTGKPPAEWNTFATADEWANYNAIWSKLACPAADEATTVHSHWQIKETYGQYQAAYNGIGGDGLAYRKGYGLSSYDSPSLVSRRYTDIRLAPSAVMYMDVRNTSYIVPESYDRMTAAQRLTNLPVRHPGGYAAVFCDGHAGMISVKDVADPTSSIWKLR
jgi:prepilin-type processing-associated H-X9-DG protein